MIPLVRLAFRNLAPAPHLREVPHRIEFALSPKLLLLDEPFGMLDALTRWELQEVLMEIWQRTRVTAICVTHDLDEAILLADRVVMMTNGPHARIGEVMKVDLPRPHTRKALLELRQRIALDDHRFVGNVGWRQNEQTFDAVRVVNTSIPHVTVDLSYIDTNGLETQYVTLGYARKAFVGLDAFSASAVYNEFRSDRLGLDYGAEIDVQLQAKWRRFNVLLKYADYDADVFATDTSKYWAEVNYVW